MSVVDVKSRPHAHTTFENLKKTGSGSTSFVENVNYVLLSIFERIIYAYFNRDS